MQHLLKTTALCLASIQLERKIYIFLRKRLVLLLKSNFVKCIKSYVHNNCITSLFEKCVQSKQSFTESLNA